MSHDFHPLEIAEIRRETDQAITVKLAVPEKHRGRFRFEPGQHLTLRAEPDGVELRRSYSLCSTPDEAELRIAIKRVEGGRFSNWANDSLQVGQAIDSLPPAGAFIWSFRADRSATYAFFASGSGITPILSLLVSGLAAEPESRFVLFYGNRDSASVLFLEELAKLKNRYMGRLAVHHMLSREDDEFDLLNGRIDRSKMADILASVLPATQIDTAFVCGPEPMMNAVETALVAAGIDPGQILSERFAASALSAERQAVVDRLERQAAGKSIKVTINGKRRQITYDPALESVLDNSRASGLPTPFGCKSGVCATCRARLVSGQVEMIRNFGLSEDEVARGYILTCQSIPVSDDVEIDFDA